MTNTKAQEYNMATSAPPNDSYCLFLLHPDSRIDALIQEYIREEVPEKRELLIQSYRMERLSFVSPKDWFPSRSVGIDGCEGADGEKRNCHNY